MEDRARNRRKLLATLRADALEERTRAVGTEPADMDDLANVLGAVDIVPDEVPDIAMAMGAMAIRKDSSVVDALLQQLQSLNLDK